MIKDVKNCGFLTTHVLDTARGCPAEGVKIALSRVSADRTFVNLGSGETNNDGRLPSPILSGTDFCKGTYQLSFYVDEYLRSHFIDQDENNFLVEIPIRFKITKPMEHYHVPLLLSPFGYSTYRGS